MFYSAAMRRVQTVFGVVAALAALGACGSRVELDTSGVTLQSSSTVSFDQEAATAGIKALFAEVLNGANVAKIDFEAERIEGASEPDMRPVLEANGANAIAQTLSTTVDSVSYPTADDCDLADEKSPCAEVIYSVSTNGTPLLTAQKGFAVLDGDKWKLSRNTFCGLAELSGGPACP